MQNLFVGMGGDDPSNDIVCKGGGGGEGCVQDGFYFNTHHAETGFAYVNI